MEVRKILWHFWL